MVKEEAFHERLYTDFYDSVNQRKQVSSDSIEALSIAKYLYIGRLRLDSLLSRTIVLTDNQILDGCFFLQEDPLALLDKICRQRDGSLPIEIRARSGTLENSILGFVKKENQPKLRGFSFSCIEDEDVRSKIQLSLRDIDSNSVSSWKDLCKIIRHSSGEESSIDKIEHGWAKWIEAQETVLKGKVLTWDRTKFPLDECIFISADRHLQHLNTNQGKELATWANKTRDRSSLDGRITKLKKGANSDLLSDLNLVEVWFHYAYNLAIARQHRCRTFESVRGSFEERISGLSLIYDSTPEISRFEAPAEIVYGLGLMPTDQFQNIYGLHSNSFKKWWDTSDPDALRRGFDPYLEVVLNQDSTSMLRAAVKYGIVGAVGGLVTGPLTGVLIGICSYFLVDHLGERELSKKSRILNRIIRYAATSIG
jgi:hypothetical protein